ncbi:spore-associated protein A [Streptosporangium subroseum]|uniref:spore-associated protein A n=1 Tax=Streptosporangium subroseum TaxID=106412 RepID=UPI003089A332|nr:spore-associated protein A [Streptosporangium subroseum]
MKNIFKRTGLLAGAMAMSVGMVGAMTSPASAATPASICGSGYSVLDSHAVGAYATVYVLYKSGGDNCVVTMLKKPDGKKHQLGAYLRYQGGPIVKDVNNYTTYAGPVRVHAPSKCIEWSGLSGIDDGTYVSPWQFCG